MPNTKNALKIIDQMVGDDAELRQMIAEENVNATIAQMIYEARTDAGLTQEKLADLVGTKQPVIARLEDADYDGHSLTMLNRIAKALNRRLRVEMKEAQPAAKRILVYVMTHADDPDAGGTWGCCNCEGTRRSWNYDAVIGVGGIEAEANGFAHRVKWIGIGPRKKPKRVDGELRHEVTFDHFRDFRTNGPDIRIEARLLAARMKRAPRAAHIMLSTKEQAEAEKLLEHAKNARPSPARAKRDAAYDQANGKDLCPRSPQDRRRAKCHP